MDVVVIGAGPAGVFAARRAAELGARTTLVTRRPSRFDAKDVDRLGMTVHERTGTASFVDAQMIETDRGLKLHADRVILCAGGTSRRLPVPGLERTATHSEAWSLTAVPSSMLVVGGGATGVQLASIFNAFGSQVQVFQSGPRILAAEDEDASAAVADAFRESGILVRESFGTIESFEATQNGVRMVFSKDGVGDSAEASIVVVVAVGWPAATEGLNLAAAGVETNARGYVRIDSSLSTSAPHVFAAGDITRRLMLVPQAIQDGFVAATNAVNGATKLGDQVSPIGSFTNPEYAPGRTHREPGPSDTRCRRCRFLTYAAMIVRAAGDAARQLDLDVGWPVED